MTKLSSAGAKAAKASGMGYHRLVMWRTGGYDASMELILNKLFRGRGEHVDEGAVWQYGPQVSSFLQVARERLAITAIEADHYQMQRARRAVEAKLQWSSATADRLAAERVERAHALTGGDAQFVD